MKHLVKTDFDGKYYRIKVLDCNRWRCDWIIIHKDEKKYYEEKLSELRSNDNE